MAPSPFLFRVFLGLSVVRLYADTHCTVDEESGAEGRDCGDERSGRGGPVYGCPAAYGL